MLALVTMGSPADAMEGSGVIHTVVAVTVVTMEPTRVGTIEVRSHPLHELISLMSEHKTTPVGVAVGSVIPRRGDPTLKSTMLANMRLLPAA